MPDPFDANASGTWSSKISKFSSISSIESSFFGVVEVNVGHVHGLLPRLDGLKSFSHGPKNMHMEIVKTLKEWLSLIGSILIEKCPSCLP